MYISKKVRYRHCGLNNRKKDYVTLLNVMTILLLIAFGRKNWAECWVMVHHEL